MNFKSDNIVPVSKEILQSIVDANIGFQNSYGADDYSKQLQQKFSEIFQTEVVFFLTNTGTAANGLALSSLVKPYQLIYASDNAHLYTDECGAPEFFTGGANLALLPSKNGKISAEVLQKSIAASLFVGSRSQKPGCISLTQTTELGTVYSLQELADIHSVAKKYALPIHIDGARFTNALVSLGCTPAELTWKAGVDVLSFGATKNGALCAEAVIFLNKNLAQDVQYLQKRAGQSVSKSRFFSAQFLAYFQEDLWLKNASHANAMAQKLMQVFTKYNFEIIYPVQANEVFVKLPSQIADRLLQKGCGFYPWGLLEDCVYRFVTSFATTESDIELFEKCLLKVEK